MAVEKEIKQMQTNLKVKLKEEEYSSEERQRALKYEHEKEVGVLCKFYDICN